MIQLDSDNTENKIKILGYLHKQKILHNRNQVINEQLNRNELRTKLKIDNDEGKLHQPINELVSQNFITQDDSNEPYRHAITTDGEAVWRFFNPK